MVTLWQASVLPALPTYPGSRGNGHGHGSILVSPTHRDTVHGRDPRHLLVDSMRSMWPQMDRLRRSIAFMARGGTPYEGHISQDRWLWRRGEGLTRCLQPGQITPGPAHAVTH